MLTLQSSVRSIQFSRKAIVTFCRHASIDTRELPTPPTTTQPVYKRYMDQLKRRMRMLGFASFEQLRDAYKPNIDDLRRRERLDSQHRQLFRDTPALPPPFTLPAVPPIPPGEGKIKTLSAFLDLEKVRSLGAAEIESIWCLRHVGSKNSLCAAIPSATFQKMANTARAHPRFVLPLPVVIDDQDSGPRNAASMHFVEWASHSPTIVTVIITHLDEFKAKGEYAIPHTVVTHHSDLQQEKGLVLLEGSVTDNCGVSVNDARWLLTMLQKFYGGVGVSTLTHHRERLLQDFSKGSMEFDIQELLEVAETL
ncbi:ATP11 domain-containing protein [Trichoderma camerunense]